MDILIRELADMPGPDCGFGVMIIGGAVGRVVEDATAYSGRHAMLWLRTEALWDDPAEDSAHLAWGRATTMRLRDFATPLNLTWLTELVRAIHADSRDTYGWRRVYAELVYATRWGTRTREPRT